MFNKEIVPFAPSLIESMRSLGYSFESAIADLIDNSISANATDIDIKLSPDSEPYIVIFDNGHGMTDTEIEEAMRYGSKNPLELREKNDLGRFGLGLKSASLSQCRQLVVISKKNNKIAGYSWDLDYVIEQQSWMLIGFNENEIKEFPKVEMLESVDSGTYILLQHFDRVKESTDNLVHTLKKNMDNTIEHLSLVFHRYLDNGVCIKVNNEKIEPKDPFLTSNKATQFKREQSINIYGSIIKVKPYILPHLSKLTHNDIKKIGSKEKLRNEQGFYVYRNKRLIIWGTWFRLERKDELSKLARVMVDIPNDLDYMWNIDIKKSTANLPDIIKKNLYNSVFETMLQSEAVHNYRGRKENNNTDIEYVWERIEVRDGYEYRINREIPQIKLLEASLDKKQLRNLDELLKQLEYAFPSTTLYLDVAKGNICDKKKKNNLDEMFDFIMEQVGFAKENGMDYLSIAKSFLSTEPYCMYDELKNKVMKEVGYE